MNLNELALKHNTDKAWHGYTTWYEKHFDQPQLATNLLEIGVASGASMRMWNDYFTNKSSWFIGIDIVEDTPKNFDDRTEIFIGDGTLFEWPYDEKLDIIIDDGSHTSEDILQAMDNWWNHLNHGGWYVIEDLAVQWRNDYGGGGTGSPATDMLKKILDRIWQKDTASVMEFHAYDEIVFLRKA